MGNVTTVLSDDERKVFEIVDFVIICSVVCLFGIAANIINMIIFYKQGFKNTVNIGFFGLAISDICCLASLQWTSICMNPLLISSHVPWFPLEIMYLTGSWPHVCFSRITSFITVYLTAERYLSIALPLKVKQIITPKVTISTLSMIFIINISTLIPEYSTTYLGWRFVSSRNQTLIGLIFTSSRSSVEGIVYVFHSFLGVISFAGVIMFTSVLVIKLGQSSKWRKKTMASNNGQNSMTNRDTKTVKMVVLIACVLIACYTPGVVIAVATLIVGQEFDIKGRYINICEAMWSVAFSIESLNSSVNIFVYYSMSSKYRQTWNELFKHKVKNNRDHSKPPANCTIEIAEMS